MPQQTLPFPYFIEDWPLPDLQSVRAQVRRSRSLVLNEERNCLLGSPEFASRLFHWLQDIEEDPCLQIWLSYNAECDEVQTHICLEVENEAAQKAEEWEMDVDSLIALSDPQGSWFHHHPCYNSPPTGMMLHLQDFSDGESVFQQQHLENMLQLLYHQKNSAAIVLSLHFCWQDRLSPHHKRRADRYKYMITQRRARRRICILSTDPITSLLRQTAFRAMTGTGYRNARWNSMSPEDVYQTLLGPVSAFAFRPKQTLNDHVSLAELRDSLTANLTYVDHQHHDPDGIPF